MKRLKQHQKLLIVFITFIFAFVEIPIIVAGQVSKPKPSDVIIVLGAKLINGEPSTMLRLRLDQTIALYTQGFANNIIVSGAKGKDETMSEALAMHYYLVEKGIPADRIYIEEHSFNTYQNLMNSKNIMDTHGWESAIIVSNASHIRRALLLANHIGLTASGSAAPMAPHNYYLTAKQYLREGAATVALWAGAY